MKAISTLVIIASFLICMTSRQHKRAARARDRGFIQSTPPRYQHLLVHESIFGRVRIQRDALMLHRACNSLSGLPHHYLGQAVQATSSQLGREATRDALRLNARAAVARHNWENDSEQSSSTIGVQQVSGVLDTETSSGGTETDHGENRVMLCLDALVVNDQDKNASLHTDDKSDRHDGNIADPNLDFVFGGDDSDDESPEDLQCICPQLHDKEFYTLGLLGNDGIVDGTVKGMHDDRFDEEPAEKYSVASDYSALCGLSTKADGSRICHIDDKEEELQGSSIFIPFDSDDQYFADKAENRSDLRWVDVLDSDEDVSFDGAADDSRQEVHEQVHDLHDNEKFGKDVKIGLHNESSLIGANASTMQDDKSGGTITTAVFDENGTVHEHLHLEARICAPWRRRQHSMTTTSVFDLTALDFSDDRPEVPVVPPGYFDFTSKPGFGIRDLLSEGEVGDLHDKVYGTNNSVQGSVCAEVHDRPLHDNNDVILHGQHDYCLQDGALEDGLHDEHDKHGEGLQVPDHKLHEEGFVFRLAEPSGRLVECISMATLHAIGCFALSGIFATASAQAISGKTLREADELTRNLRQQLSGAVAELEEHKDHVDFLFHNTAMGIEDVYFEIGIHRNKEDLLREDFNEVFDDLCECCQHLKQRADESTDTERVKEDNEKLKALNKRLIIDLQKMKADKNSIKDLESKQYFAALLNSLQNPGFESAWLESNEITPNSANLEHDAQQPGKIIANYAGPLGPTSGKSRKIRRGGRNRKDKKRLGSPLGCAGTPPSAPLYETSGCTEYHSSAPSDPDQLDLQQKEDSVFTFERVLDSAFCYKRMAFGFTEDSLS